MSQSATKFSIGHPVVLSIQKLMNFSPFIKPFLIDAIPRTGNNITTCNWKYNGDAPRKEQFLCFHNKALCIYSRECTSATNIIKLNIPGRNVWTSWKSHQMEKVQALTQIWAYFLHNITIKITESRTSEGCGLSRFIVKIRKKNF